MNKGKKRPGKRSKKRKNENEEGKIKKRREDTEQDFYIEMLSDRGSLKSRLLKEFGENPTLSAAKLIETSFKLRQIPDLVQVVLELIKKKELPVVFEDKSAKMAWREGF